jgi:ParB family transcriptional regulator, chromosome partitioning protein
MSIADKLTAKTAGVKAREVDNDKPGEKTLKTAPAMFIDAAQRMDAAETRAEALEAQVTVLKNRKVRIADLSINAARKRSLTPEAFAELRENLKHHPLTHPIVIRPMADGKFEVVAGANRVQAYQDLGREDIEADVVDIQDDQVEEAAFYSNLFNSPLSDYEKFQGFKGIQARTKETQSQMAARTGVSEAKISYLFSFDKLAPAVLEAIDAAPHSIGAKAASKLVAMPVEEAIGVIRKLAGGELSQGAAISGQRPPDKSRARPIIIKNGKAIVAQIETRQCNLIIKLRDEKFISEIRDRLQELIRSVVK